MTHDSEADRIRASFAETYGVLTPMSLKSVGTQGDLLALFAVIREACAPAEAPVILGDLWRGWVDPSRGPELAAELPLVEGRLRIRPLGDAEAERLGVSATLLSARQGASAADLWPKFFDGLREGLEEQDVMAARGGSKPAHRIGIGPTSISGHMTFRHRPRDDFFAEGPPIWTR